MQRYQQEMTSSTVSSTSNDVITDDSGVDLNRGFTPSEVMKNSDQRQFLTDLSLRIFSNPVTHNNGRKRSLSAARLQSKETEASPPPATRTHPLQRGRSFHTRPRVLHISYYKTRTKSQISPRPFFPLAHKLMCRGGVGVGLGVV